VFDLESPYHPPGVFWFHPHPHGISITLAFDRDEQRGEHGAPGVFPYHCHILEHEDGG
jgi:FtsP/CotA-like multicopper oxidase with cupredoxin domain